MKRLALAACGALAASSSALCLAVAQTPAPPAGDAARGKALAQERCAACHGSEGNSAEPQFPHLAGQFPEYLEKQIRAFRAEGGQPPKRVSPIMRPVADGLTLGEITDLAAYYASLPLMPNGTLAAGNLELGRKIYLEGNPDHDLPACVSCHRANGEGIRPDFPRIGGQSPDYLDGQLANWMETRGHPGKLMSIVVPRLQADERKAVADYISQLHPQPQ